MYKVWLVNFGWYLSEEYTDLAEAIERGRNGGFDFRIDKGDEPILAWSILSGYKYF